MIAPTSRRGLGAAGHLRRDRRGQALHLRERRQCAFGLVDDPAQAIDPCASLRAQTRLQRIGLCHGVDVRRGHSVGEHTTWRGCRSLRLRDAVVANDCAWCRLLGTSRQNADTTNSGTPHSTALPMQIFSTRIDFASMSDIQGNRRLRTIGQLSEPKSYAKFIAQVCSLRLR
jgi:hypothetical protein